MKVALVDNGSLEPSAHEALRQAADAISRAAGIPVEGVSWRHSDRIPAGSLAAGRAWTLAPWIRAQRARGEHEFTLIPFLISTGGAIATLMRRDLEALRGASGFAYAFTPGLSDGATLAQIVASRALGTSGGLQRPVVVVVDHGGPSPESAEVRNRVAAGVRDILGPKAHAVIAASMESPHGPGFGFNRPLLSEALAAPGLGGVVIAPLFLSPGRHAGPGGDLSRIAREAEARFPRLRCRLAETVGAHPAAASFLALALEGTMAAEARP
jgi:sirohydrochlorin ferrochelatase